MRYRPSLRNKTFARSNSQNISRRKKKQHDAQRNDRLELIFEKLEARQMLSAVPPGQAPFGASEGNQDFMVGNVNVAVVLFESDGTQDNDSTDWSSTHVGYVKSGIEQAHEWWEDVFDYHNPDSPHDLEFTFDYTYTDNPFQTGWEAVEGNLSLAKSEFVAHLGQDIGDWNHSRRVASGSDWAITVFVPNRIGYGYGKSNAGGLGGPSHSSTYWGQSVSDFARTVAHETGHLFHGVDEYSSGYLYDGISGYYGTQAFNANKNRPPEAGDQEPSLMGGGDDWVVDGVVQATSIWEESWNRGSASTITEDPLPQSTREHLGWRDNDGGGVIDIFDELPILEGFGRHIGTNEETFAFEGHTEPGLLEAVSTKSSTLNFVDAVQVQVVIDGSEYAGDLYRPMRPLHWSKRRPEIGMRLNRNRGRTPGIPRLRSTWPNLIRPSEAGCLLRMCSSISVRPATSTIVTEHRRSTTRSLPISHRQLSRSNYLRPT